MVIITTNPINPIVGDIKGNANKIIKSSIESYNLNANIAIFPEMALTGYPLEDIIYNQDFNTKHKIIIKYLEDEFNKNINNTLIIFGSIYQHNNKYYNSVYIYQNNKIDIIYHKQNLPNYGVFDDKRYFTSGNQYKHIEYLNHRILFTICEDIWQDKKGVISYIKNNDISLLISINASPYTISKPNKRRTIINDITNNTNCYAIYTNMLGGQDDLIYDGDSFISKNGNIQISSIPFISTKLIFCIDKTYINNTPIEYKTKNITHHIYNALTVGLSDYCQKNKLNKIVIGLSGGIDSAIATTIAYHAIRDITCLIIPSKYTSKQSINDAITLCKNLSINYHIISIDNIMLSYEKSINNIYNNETVYTNLQARIRNNIIMAFANNYNMLPLNTSNKSETACGYTTLYGDSSGCFSPLKDIYKTTIYKLAKWYNNQHKHNIIPSSIITKEPSAELKYNQLDKDNLPPYDILDTILFLYIDQQNTVNEIIQKTKYDKSLINKIINLVEINEFKRNTMAPGVKISEISFGKKDRRMPISKIEYNNITNI